MRSQLSQEHRSLPVDGDSAERQCAARCRLQRIAPLSRPTLTIKNNRPPPPSAARCGPRRIRTTLKTPMANHSSCADRIRGTPYKTGARTALPRRWTLTPSSASSSAWTQFHTPLVHGIADLPRLAQHGEGAPPDFTVGPHPWKRTGPGTATDGGLKFDLTKFNKDYFDRLRARVKALHDAGIYVGVYLFSGEFQLRFRFRSDGYPFSGPNNVNEVSMTATGAGPPIRGSLP